MTEPDIKAIIQAEIAPIRKALYGNGDGDGLMHQVRRLSDDMYGSEARQHVGIITRLSRLEAGLNKILSSQTESRIWLRALAVMGFGAVVDTLSGNAVTAALKTVLSGLF